ncbi:unnamed protein product [Rotaria magnacalcarata]|uniref:Uncharacterized protein n=2 Tax=Rotaria magnacalcarata TaxID=392030 RepID=A0A816GNM1_9BILA|nr:unnamed protein product [Rotaria magnacalcarata]CAF1675536.1 unnamed protein product [Rotaria magnacalcarata]CAF2031593.1 unnamed protein product [Rotaria magnacalcarata]CAF2197592.1 unnamed protein product [Rotaria magnacalcarata]
MYYNSGTFLMFIYFIITAWAERESFEKKCKRQCNVEHGSLNCWRATTDGFTYGLSTAMVDYCQALLQLRQTADDKESWYNISRYILIQQIGNYDIARKARQLTKTDISHVATSLLDKCFHDTTSTSSVQPSCPLCSKAQSNLIIQTRTLSLILISGCVIFIVFIVLLHAFYSYHSHRSYQSI